MNIKKYLLAAAAVVGIVLVSVSYTSIQKQDATLVFQVHSGTIRSQEDLTHLFPRNAAEIQARTDEVLTDAAARLTSILAVPSKERTYQNTIEAFDRLCAFSPMSIFRSVAVAVSMVSPDAEMRDAAHAASSQLDAFAIDTIGNNKELFIAIKSYAEESSEPLSETQRYYITEVVNDFKRGGMELSEEKRAKIATLQKELADLSRMFEINIAKETKTAIVSKEGLIGLDDDFVGALQQTEDGQYILTTDYPTYFGTMMRCCSEETRKRLYRAFSNCGYPANEEVLKAIIAKRDTIAQELGFESYAHLNLDDQMCKHPKNVEKFLSELVSRSAKKEQLEFEKLVADLPESVELTQEGKLKAWDGGYIRTHYRKKHFQYDERLVAEYFPVDQTLQKLLVIYEDFLGLSFRYKTAPNLWHSDVKLIEAYDASSNELLGYLLLDLHPRPNKFTHACHCSIVPSIILSNGSKPCAASLVVANFPKPVAGKPALLQLSDVQTFFHEFGHALHSLLGRTEIASFSGTKVKMDFVEMPSQMLEEWLGEKEVLQKISSHYETGKPLPDTLIDTIRAVRHLDTGAMIQRQALLSLVSLQYFAAGADKDVAVAMRDLFLATCPNSDYDDESHAYASFGHLTGYGARYYGYMWSRVFGLDLFHTIKEHGMSREIGKKYVTEVLSKGGSKDPMELLTAFLGREPQQDAFFKHLGE